MNYTRLALAALLCCPALVGVADGAASAQEEITAHVAAIDAASAPFIAAAQQHAAELDALRATQGSTAALEARVAELEAKVAALAAERDAAVAQRDAAVAERDAAIAARDELAAQLASAREKLTQSIAAAIAAALP